ncbi:MAG: hypothetical protein EA422_06575 [Gemmatimonadales bacterium]|nr:MAG: hypothetical protein EA422_06575 [Gemmatimonadales bacterium]
MGSRPLERDIRGLLGLARRAGVLEVGVGAARDAVRSGRARMVILARDGAGGQLGKLLPLLEHREVPQRWVQRRGDLGGALGMSSVSAVAVTTNSFADQFLAVLSAGAESVPGKTEDGREAKEESGTNAGC